MSSDYHLVQLRDKPRCDARWVTHGFAGGNVTLSCHFDVGHKGMHQDPATGTEWSR